MIQQVYKYLKTNRESSIDEAVKIIEQISNVKKIQIEEVINLKSEWRQYKSDYRLGIDRAKLPDKLKNVKNTILSICTHLKSREDNISTFEYNFNPKPKLFISFNNQDKEHVDLIESVIGNDFVEVIRFDKHFNGSNDIEDSINASIKKSKATLLIVSFHSLSSAWVGTETHLSLVSEDLLNRKIFVCSFDNSLFDPILISEIAIELENKKNTFNEEIRRRKYSDNVDENIETYDFDEDNHRIVVHKSSFINTVKALKKKPNYLLFGKGLEEELRRLVKDIKEII